MAKPVDLVLSDTRLVHQDTKVDLPDGRTD